MTPLPLPYTQEIVLVGGGHAHALVLRKWAMKPLAGARLTVINPGPTAPYTGMLPGFVAGHYRREDLEIDIVRLARFAGARMILGVVDNIDLGAKRIIIPERAPIAYDIASINIGITSDPPNVPGFLEFGIAAKPLGLFARAWRELLERAANGETPTNIVMIGAGVGGVELSLAMHHALKTAELAPRITIVDAADALVGMGHRAQSKLRRTLATNGIELIEHSPVVVVEKTQVTLADGREIPAIFTVGAAGARPFGWLGSTGLELKGGFIRVDEFLKTSDPSVFAAGDCAVLPNPRSKAGVFAVRQAPILFDNLVASASDGNLRPFRPQKDYLKLISLGTNSALADKYGRAFQGSWVWRWKDHIDRKFMAQFRNFPEMPKPKKPIKMAADLAPLFEAKPLCGGCAAKVGQDALAQALAGLSNSGRDDIIQGAGDDAAILSVGGQTQVLTTDTLRTFTNDPWLMARIAAVHALGDVWAMGATPQAVLAQITLPPLSVRLQQEWLAEIMHAANEVVTEAGAQIVGGHTALGAELMIGFTSTGVGGSRVIGLGGAMPGDVLILTKPLGSGVILAAEMESKARGSDVAAAYEMMSQPQGTASQILRCAHAMTDITGFGFAGHLMGMCNASGVSADIDLAAISAMRGALDLIKQGTRASLYPENLRNAPISGGSGPQLMLLHDPQTAGGLLASVDPKDAKSIIQALIDAGYPAVIVGQITGGAPGLRVI